MKFVFKMMKLVLKMPKLVSPAFYLHGLGWIAHKKKPGLSYHVMRAPKNSHFEAR